MQIVFVREAKEITGSAGEMLGATGKAKGRGDDVVIPGLGVRRPNSLAPKTTDSSSGGGSGGGGGNKVGRDFTGGKQGGGGRIDQANYGAKDGEQVRKGLGRGNDGRWIKFDDNQSDEDRVSKLSGGDASAARMLSIGGNIDEATKKRLGDAGLLEIDAKGRVVISPGARNAMLMSQDTAAKQAQRIKVDQEAKAEAKAEAKKKEREAAAEAKASARAAQRKEEQIKAKAEAKVERDAAIAKSAADKEAAKIKAVAEAEAAQNKQVAMQRKTMSDTAVKAGVAKGEVDSLLDFANGNDLQFGSPMAQKLLELGLITQVQGAKGYMLGALASPFLNAAMSGNARGAKDMLAQYGMQKRAAEMQAQLVAPKINEIGGQAANVNVRTIGAGGGAKPLPFTPILKKTKEVGGDKGRIDWIVFPRISGGAGRGGLLGVAQKAINIVFGKS